MTSKQMEAFKVSKEPKDMLEKYGDNNFGSGCLMARRLVEVGVPFIEVIWAAGTCTGTSSSRWRSSSCPISIRRWRP